MYKRNTWLAVYKPNKFNIDKILNKFNKYDIKSMNTPIDDNVHVSKNISESLSQLDIFVL